MLFETYTYFLKEGPIIITIFGLLLLILYLLALKQYSRDWRKKLGSNKEQSLLSSIKSPFLSSFSPKISLHTPTNSLLNPFFSVNTAPSKQLNSSPFAFAKTFNLLDKSIQPENSSISKKFSESSAINKIYTSETSTSSSPQIPNTHTPIFEQYDPLKDSNFTHKIALQKNSKNIPRNLHLDTFETTFFSKTSPNKSPLPNTTQNNDLSLLTYIFQKCLIIPIFPLVAVYLFIRIFWDLYRIIVFISVDILLSFLTGAYTVYGNSLPQIKLLFYKIFQATAHFFKTTLKNNYGAPKLAVLLENFYFDAFLPVFNFIVSAYVLISSAILVMTSVTYILIGKAILNSKQYWQKALAFVSTFAHLTILLKSYLYGNIQKLLQFLFSNILLFMVYMFKTIQSTFNSFIDSISKLTKCYIIPATTRLYAFFLLYNLKISDIVYLILRKLLELKSQITFSAKKAYFAIKTLFAQIYHSTAFVYAKSIQLYYLSKPIIVDAAKFATATARKIKSFTDASFLLLMKTCEIVAKFCKEHYCIYLLPLIRWCGKKIAYFKKEYALPLLRYFIFKSHLFLLLLKNTTASLALKLDHAYKKLYLSFQLNSVIVYNYITIFTQELWVNLQPARKELTLFTLILFKNAYFVLLDLVTSLVQYIYFFSKIITSVAIKLVDDGNKATHELIASTRDQADKFLGTWSNLRIQADGPESHKKFD
ncbi:hypothetical protein BB561_005636 [Smittium simulii]|uniref:Uncharacterized protein n=1 Tax=Smittium simulii TaxID=133385 RepID=A0A2T9Y9H3_9FUNG|nr:hypothetical protein BB561_005636 [Smittium simulii]